MSKELKATIHSIKSITGKITNSYSLPAGKISNTILHGQSAYDLAVENGFEGTEEEWIASLKGEPGEKGEKGEDGRSIVNVVLSETTNNIDTYIIYFSDGSISTFQVVNGIDGRQGDKGDKGDTGRGISSIVKTFSANGIDTYTITYTDNTTSTYTVTNGKDGQKGEKGQDGLSVLVEVLVNTDSEYVLRFTNGTSTFTTPNLRAIADLTDYATKEWVENKNYLTQHQDISSKANISDLAAVATSGNYNDLSNKPIIPTVPTNISNFNNDAGYQTASDVSTSISTALSSVLSYKGTVATVNALPSSNNKIGDVYHVTANGSEYAWNGSAWEELGSSVDLTGYATETWVENQSYLTQHQDISGKANSADLATVATSGSYNDLIDKPVISTGADWDASDGEDGYIENKPFYKEISSQTTIVEEQTIREDYSSGQVSLTYVNGFSGFNDNETIIVIIDNEQYPLNAIKEDDYYQYVEGYDKTGNYFKIFYDSGSLYYLAEKVHGFKTISIVKNVYTYHKLDSNYIDTENTIATYAYVDDVLLDKVDSSDLATVATTGNYNDLSNKPTIPTVPTNVSSFTNDAGYLTSHQSLTGYATEQWVGQQGYLTNYTETDPTVPAWAKASTKPSYTASEVGALPSTTVIPSKTSDLTNDSGFVTQEDVKEQILSDDYTEEKVPYLYREAPYSVASVEEKIVGGTVGWNQLCNGASVTVTNGHKYYMIKGGVKFIGASTGTAITGLTSGTDIVTDLTTMLGSTIADYIYSIEQSTAGAGVAKLKEWGFFTEDYYEYCEPTLKSVEGLTSKVTVGFNQFNVVDADLEAGNFDGMGLSNNVHTEGYIKVLPNTAYHFHQDISMNGVYIRLYDAEKTNFTNRSFYSAQEINFTTLEDTHFIRIMWYSSAGITVQDVKNGDINLNFHWDGSRDGEYEPYVKHSYALDDSLTLRGIPKLDSSNNLYYDGDDYESDGTVSRRFTERDYQSGDESLADAITDGTTTVVKLATPTTETALPYHNPQLVGDTEEFVTTGIVPVGHDTKYYDGTMNLINSKADKATTYTKTEVDTALSAKAGTAVATTSANGLMSSTDKGRLDDLYADYSSALTALGVN